MADGFDIHLRLPASRHAAQKECPVRSGIDGGGDPPEHRLLGGVQDDGAHIFIGPVLLLTADFPFTHREDAGGKEGTECANARGGGAE
jgi:hypothetical protein